LYYLLSGFAASDSINAELASFHEDPLIKRLKEKGVKTHVLQRRRKLDLSVFVRLFKLLNKIKADVIHMHGYLSILFGIPAAMAAGTPVRVVTLHASPILLERNKPNYKLLLYLWIAYMTIKISRTYLIAVSNDIYNSHLKFRKIDPSLMKVVHNGISIEKVRSHLSSVSRKDLGIDDACFIVGMVGRLDENKGHIYLLRAAQVMLTKRQDVHFIIIGDGPLESERKGFCTTNHLEGHVHFVGFHKSILDFMSLLHVMVIASMHEGIPYTLLEAMAKSVPVIATDVAGIQEVMRNGINGLLVPPRSSEGIASNISLLLSNTALKECLSKAGLEVLNHRFSQEYMVQSTAKVYDEILSSGQLKRHLNGQEDFS